MPQVVRDPFAVIIYNLFPLLAGKVRDWRPHLARAADLGFDWVMVNPIQQPGYSGSLYSIKDYFAFNPLIVDGAGPAQGAADFKSMSALARQMGLRLMVDLVINHCAFDSDLTRQHPGWFRHEHGRLAHPSCKDERKRVTVWKDLVQFDQKNSPDAEGLYQYLLKVVGFLAELGFSGFRCDAAYQLPESFWRRLIAETRQRQPDAVFLAETLGCTPAQTSRTARAGFEYIFNSSKWWDFSSPWLLEQYDLTRLSAKSVSFPESHDTERLAQEQDGNLAALKQRYLFSALFSSGVLMPIGFEFAFRKRLDVVETRPADWEQTGVDLSDFIRKMNKVKSENPVFQQDAATRIVPTRNADVLVLWKGSAPAGQEALIILNKDVRRRQSFHSDDLYRNIQAPGPLTDVSPEYPLSYLPTPFEYDLRPGQGIVLVTGKSR
jgi:starch synthase (maltosyl-transferring)